MKKGWDSFKFQTKHSINVHIKLFFILVQSIFLYKHYVYQIQKLHNVFIKACIKFELTTINNIQLIVKLLSSKVIEEEERLNMV